MAQPSRFPANLADPSTTTRWSHASRSAERSDLRAPASPGRASRDGIGGGWWRSSGIAALAVVALAMVVLAVHVRRYLPFIADDALISLRYARRLLSGHGLTWTDGPRVEGYSNLLWVLCAAALGRFGVDLILAVRMLGIAGTAAAVIALARANRSGPGSLPAATACLGFVLGAPVAVWAIGGLETPLVAALLAWSIALLLPLVDTPRPPARAVLVPGLLLALLCLTRPDGPVLVAGAALGLVLARGPGIRSALALVALPIAFVIAQVVFRRFYYGEWLPNPAFAKLGISLIRLRGGLGYVLRGLLWALPLLLGAASLVVAPGRDARGTRRMVFLGALLVIWCGYVVAIGGDIFPARRHLVPVLLVLCFLAGDAAAVWSARLGSRAIMATAAGLLGLFLVLQIRDPETQRARDEFWEWRGEVVGRLLARGFADRQPLIAVDPAGCVPYFSELPAIDMLGLNDRFLAHHPPHPIGSGRLGHELGNGKYVLDREPDLVLFSGPGGSAHPVFPSGLQMVGDPRFAARYRLTNFDGRDPFTVRSRIWVRAEGGRLGIERAPGRIVVPGWLMGADSTIAAELDSVGRMTMPARADHPARIEALTLPSGGWTLRVDGTSPRHLIEIRDHVRGSALARGPDGLRFVLAGDPPGLVDLSVAPEGDTLSRVRRVVLTRAPGR